MPDRQNRPSGTSLPPCSQLLRGLSRCRVPECNSYFPSDAERLHHETTCDVAIERTRHYSSFPHRPAQYPVQPHRLETHFASTSIDTDSDEGSVVFIPDNSRAPSLCDPTERRQSGVIRTASRRYRSSSSTPESDRRNGNAAEPTKRLKKLEKEKHNRSEIGSVLYREEDFLRNYCGWEKREQSGGNGNGAGLYANKSTIMRGAEDLLYFFIDREYRQGLADGTLRERQAMMCEILEGAPARAPYAGTFLDPGNETVCKHEDSKAKECITHGNPDWRECRRLHVDARFQARRDAYVEQLGRTRVQQEGFITSRGSGSQSRPGSSRRGFAEVIDFSHPSRLFGSTTRYDRDDYLLAALEHSSPLGGIFERHSPFLRIFCSHGRLGQKVITDFIILGGDILAI